MDASTITVIAACVAALVGLLNFFWRIPDIERRLMGKFSDLSTRVGRVEGLLEGWNFSGKSPTPVMQSESPLRLTEFGQSVSEALGAATWAKETAEKVSSELSDPPAYVVQIYCFDFVKKPERLGRSLRLSQPDRTESHEFQ